MNEREDLKAYLDHELPEDRAREVGAALERDATLRQEASELLAVQRAVQEIKEPMPYGMDSTLAALERRRTRMRMPRWAVWGAGAAAAGACALAVLFLVPTAQRSSTTDAVAAVAPPAGPSDAGITEQIHRSVDTPAAGAAVPQDAKLANSDTDRTEFAREKAAPRSAAKQSEEAEPREGMKEARVSSAIKPHRAGGQVADRLDGEPSPAGLAKQGRRSEPVADAEEPVIVSVASAAEAEQAVATIVGRFGGSIVARDTNGNSHLLIAEVPKDQESRVVSGVMGLQGGWNRTRSKSAFATGAKPPESRAQANLVQGGIGGAESVTATAPPKRASGRRRLRILLIVGDVPKSEP